MASHLRCWRIGGATSFPCGLYGLYGLCCVNTWPLHIFLSGSCNACRFYMKKTSQSPPSRFGFKLFAMRNAWYHVPKHAVLRVRRWCFRGRFCRRIRGLFRLLRICLRELDWKFMLLALSENLRLFILQVHVPWVQRISTWSKNITMLAWKNWALIHALCRF